jgi:glycosyltransferase involved in cell wall biosynthesis
MGEFRRRLRHGHARFRGIRFPDARHSKAGVHYVSLRFDQLAEAVEFMAANKKRLSAIGEAGRVWALEHYSPKAVAMRFIDEIAKAFGQIN